MDIMAPDESCTSLEGEGGQTASLLCVCVCVGGGGVVSLGWVSARWKCIPFVGFLLFWASDAAAVGPLAGAVCAVVVILRSVGPLTCLFSFFSGRPVGWTVVLAWGESICKWWGATFFHWPLYGLPCLLFGLGVVRCYTWDGHRVQLEDS